MDTSALVGLWMEFEVLVLVGVAMLAGQGRLRSERRRISAVRKLRRRAVRDSLTGLFNRRGLVSVLSRPRWTEAAGGRSVLLLDLDGFKQVNDRYGHMTGDRVLLTVSHSLFALAVEGIVSARLGGDEFLLVRSGPAFSDREAARLIDRLRSALREEELPEVSASYGAAHDPEGRQSIDRLVVSADLALARNRGLRADQVHDTDRFLSGWDEDGARALLERGRELMRLNRANVRHQAEVVKRLRKTGLVCACLALLLSLGAMLAIPLDIIQLRTVEVEGALSFTTSLVLAISATAMIFMLAKPTVSPARRHACRLFGWFVVAIGAMVVVEHLTGRTFLPTELLDDPLEGQVEAITRPDLESGLGFIFGGLYTVQVGRHGRLVEAIRTLVSFGLIAVIAAAAFGILLGAGYLWQGNSLTLSPQGMLAGALLAVALLAAEPGSFLLRPFLSGGGAAHISNRLVVAGVAVPMVAGVILAHADLAQGLGWGSSVLALSLFQAALLGALTITSMRAVNDADRETVEVWRQLAEVADRDPLTGLFNRERLAREVAVSQRLLIRQGKPYSIVLLDLDQLKRLNSEQGYAAGDMALREVAASLQSGVRPTDLPVRLGGDEFGILLPDTIEDEAREVARRCAGRLRRSGGEDLKVSWGVATAVDRRIQVADVLAQADRRLYEAKNRVAKPEPILQAD
jgi:diguanylate cyclase (GGDEF)-like protein